MMDLTIVGLGTVGTSIALALKQAAPQLQIMGHDPDRDRVKRARDVGGIDESHWNLVEACRESPLIVLDLPLSEIRLTLEAVREDLAQGAVLLDTAPVKRAVLEMAGDLLPEHASLVGGHVVSSRLGGRPEPSADLMHGATFYLVAASRTRPEALETASNLVEATGAKPVYIDAAEHDGLVAATHQLPVAAAISVLQSLSLNRGKRGRAASAGAELSDLSLMVGEADEMVETLHANADNLHHWIDRQMAQLQRLQDLLQSGDQELLLAELKQAQATAREMLQGPADDEDEPGGTVTGLWGQMLFGRRRRS